MGCHLDQAQRVERSSRLGGAKILRRGFALFRMTGAAFGAGLCRPLIRDPGGNPGIAVSYRSAPWLVLPPFLIRLALLASFSPGEAFGSVGRPLAIRGRWHGNCRGGGREKNVLSPSQKSKISATPLPEGALGAVCGTHKCVPYRGCHSERPEGVEESASPTRGARSFGAASPCSG